MKSNLIKQFAILIMVLFYLSITAQTYKQNVKGIVIDKQTKISLIGATIIIQNSNPLTGTTSDANGYFRLDNINVGRYDFSIKYIGYNEAIIKNILVTSGKEIFLNVELQQNATDLNEIVISANKKNDAINKMASISARTFSVEETGRYAGSRADPARMASNYAGVVGGGDMRNDIIVRGNSPTGILWRIEGLEIPNPNHFSFVGTSGGIFSMLNNNLLSNSDFITSAFPAEYGNKNSAVFDLKLRNGNSEKREYVFQAGLNGLEFGVEGGFSKNERASYLINYRLLSMKPAKRIGINFKSSGIPNFQDFSFKLYIPTEKSGVFSVFGIGGTSTLSILDSERKPEDWEATDNDDITFGSNTGFVGLTHAYIFNKKTYGKFSYLMAATKINTLREYVYLDKNPKLKENLKLNNYYFTFKYELNHKFSPRHFIKSGISYQPKIYDFYQKELDEKDSTLYHINYDEKGNTSIIQSYASWQYRPTNELTINTGIHFQYLTLNGASSLEPRLSLKYQISKGKTFALGYGLHSQTLPMIYYTHNYTSSTGKVQQTNKNLDFSRSHHLVTGYDQAFGNNFRIKAEVYYQKLFNIPVSKKYPFYSTVTQGAEFSFWVPDSLKNSGTGKNYGLELTFEKFYSNNYYFLITASFFESKFKGGTNQEYSSPFSLGYVGNVLFGYELNIIRSNALIFDFKTTMSGGKRYIPIDLNKSIEMGKEVRNFDNAYKSRFNDFLKTDIKISYRINKKKSTHFVFIAIDNVFNNKNVLTKNYNNATKKVQDTYQIGIFPYGGYRVQF